MLPGTYLGCGFSCMLDLVTASRSLVVRLESIGRTHLNGTRVVVGHCGSSGSAGGASDGFAAFRSPSLAGLVCCGSGRMDWLGLSGTLSRGSTRQDDRLREQDGDHDPEKAVCQNPGIGTKSPVNRRGSGSRVAIPQTFIKNISELCTGMNISESQNWHRAGLPAGASVFQMTAHRLMDSAHVHVAG